MEETISEAASKNTEWDWRIELAKMKDDALIEIAARGNPEPAIAARAILAEREASSKKRRGRPRVMDKLHAKTAKDCAPDIKTTRGLQNVHYRQQALVCLGLGDDERFKWLCDGAAMMKGAAGAWKPGILTELGRIVYAFGPETMKEAALSICQMKPKTKRAIVLLRGFRRQITKPQGTIDGLKMALCKAIDDYRLAHPGVSLEMAREAINEAYCVIETMIERQDA